MPEHDEHRSSGRELAPISEPAPSPDFLDRLYQNFLHGLSEFVGHPLSRPSTTVRGIVRPNARGARIFLLTDSDFDSSVAIDIPLVDSHDRQNTHSRAAAFLRAVVSGGYVDMTPVAETTVGVAVVTVFDVRGVMDAVTESDAFEDYVRMTLYGLVEPRSPSFRNHGHELTFTGFIILDESVVRYYFDLPGGHVAIGVDCPLRTRDNRKRFGGATFLRVKIKELFDTGVMESLLVPGTRDDYCQVVYDATGHL